MPLLAGSFLKQRVARKQQAKAGKHHMGCFWQAGGTSLLRYHLGGTARGRAALHQRQHFASIVRFSNSLHSCNVPHPSALSPHCNALDRYGGKHFINLHHHSNHLAVLRAHLLAMHLTWCFCNAVCSRRPSLLVSLLSHEHLHEGPSWSS